MAFSKQWQGDDPKFPWRLVKLGFYTICGTILTTLLVTGAIALIFYGLIAAIFISIASIFPCIVCYNLLYHLFLWVPSVNARIGFILSCTLTAMVAGATWAAIWNGFMGGGQSNSRVFEDDFVLGWLTIVPGLWALGLANYLLRKEDI